MKFSMSHYKMPMTTASGCCIPSPHHPFISMLPLSFLSLPISSFIPFFSSCFLSFTFTYFQRVSWNSTRPLSFIFRNVWFFTYYFLPPGLGTIDYICGVGSSELVCAIVVDPWHFGTDPDPRIRGSDQLIQIRLRILLFSSLTFKNFLRKKS